MFQTEELSVKLSGFADAAIIFSAENRLYFTRFPSTDGVLLVLPEGALFFTDSRYTEAAKRVLGDDNVFDSANLYAALSAVFTQYSINKAAVEDDRLTIAELARFKEKLPQTEFVCDSSLRKAINSLRSVKCEEEKLRVLKAQAIAERAFAHILGFIKPGVTEKEIALELDFFMLRNGAEALSFETIAISGKNTSMPHGVPSGKKVENGDFVTMDYGAVYRGYHSDMTRTIAVGKPSKKQREIYSTVLEAQRAALSVLKSGISGVEADAAARSVIANAGYGEYFRHSIGHGVGIEIHEAPYLSPKSRDILTCGNIVTVEPGIYIPGEFGVRTEDMAFITENGCENLTSAPKELIIL